MNDFNSRYRNLDDQPSTIRTNAGGYGYGGFGNDMDIMQAENAQKKKQVSRASQARGGSSSRGRKAKRQMLIYGIIIAVEVILLAVIWINYISFAKKAKGGSDDSGSAQTESSAEGGNNINVENDNFTLICNKLTITTDASGSPVAVVGFTFTNKTDNALSMNDVFAPSFKQNGADLMTGAMLPEQPAEIANTTTQISGGASLDCAYAVSLQDNVSDITITMRDNYETFSDIGSVVVPIAQ